MVLDVCAVRDGVAVRRVHHDYRVGVCGGESVAEELFPGADRLVFDHGGIIGCDDVVGIFTVDTEAGGDVDTGEWEPNIERSTSKVIKVGTIFVLCRHSEAVSAISNATKRCRRCALPPQSKRANAECELRW